MDDGRVVRIETGSHAALQQRVRPERKVAMIRKFLLPALAAIGVMFAIYSVVTAQRQIPPAPPVTEPAQPQFASYVAGAGIVEASTENIAVGTFVPGVVTEMYVKVGDQVKAGARLFKVDDRDLQAELEVRKAASKSAAANVATGERDAGGREESARAVAGGDG
jgi:multidrug efflux pump subunit AcrA (membrane-fusion protein)